jgi:hypothetical protein
VLDDWISEEVDDFNRFVGNARSKVGLVVTAKAVLEYLAKPGRYRRIRTANGFGIIATRPYDEMVRNFEELTCSPVNRITVEVVPRGPGQREG